MMDRDGRPQGPTPRIPAALAPSILRSLLLRASEGRKSIGPYLNGSGRKGCYTCLPDRMLHSFFHMKVDSPLRCPGLCYILQL